MKVTLLGENKKFADDKAGVGHWDDTYIRWPVCTFNPHPRGVRYFGRKKWHALFAKAFCNHDVGKVDIVEVGCGGSKYLPYFAKEFGFEVSGIDYSVNGCALAEKSLNLADVKGNIYNADLFDLPQQLVGTFDVAVSFGLVEHFSDTAAPISHIANLLKSGGLIITIVPNMAGICGWAQKLICRDVYDIHQLVTKDILIVAHETAGFTIVEAGYLEFVNFGVVNIGTNSTGLKLLFKVVLHKVLLGITLFTWAAETIFGSFAGNSVTSPYIYCIAKKETQSSCQ